MTASDRSLAEELAPGDAVAGAVAEAGPRRVRLPSAERRRELIAIASDLFRRRGFHEVGMREIALAADIRAASLYHHFESKMDLLRAIVDTVSTDFINAHAAALDPGKSCTVQLRELLRLQILYLAANSDALFVADREIPSLPPAIRDEIQGRRRQYQHLIGEFIARGVEGGEFRVRDPRLAGIAVLDMVNGLNRWFRPEGESSIDAVADQYANMIVGEFLGADYVPRSRKRRPRPE
jgi:TetR/AcrR family transcriptional regulator, cholesterol catabolism regulator